MFILCEVSRALDSMFAAVQVVSARAHDPSLYSIPRFA